MEIGLDLQNDANTQDKLKYEHNQGVNNLLGNIMLFQLKLLDVFLVKAQNCERDLVFFKK